MQAVLPTEILALTLQQLERKDIPSVLRANGTFYDIAVPILYRSIHYLPVARSIACLKILKHNPALTMLVYDLSIDWSDYQITGNLLRLLRSVLQQLKHLRSLSLELSPIDNHGTHAWVFENAPYSLHTFTTSSRCDDVLASVLERQPHIVDLSLCGYQTNVPFTLSPSALPRLESLRCTHAGAAVVAEVVRGRPVGTMSISLYADEGFGALDTLLLVKSSLRRLTLMALDDLSATSVLNEVAARVPKLQALHIVVLLSQYTYVCPLTCDSILNFTTHPLIGKSHGSRPGSVQLQGAPLYYRDGRYGGRRHRRPQHSKGMA